MLLMTLKIKNGKKGYKDMKKKLIELLEAELGFSRYMTDDERREKLAEHLITNGVIVLPFPIGTPYYRIVTKRAKVGFPYFKSIRKAELNWYNVDSVLSDFGKTVFLTKEEAQIILEKENKQ